MVSETTNPFGDDILEEISKEDNAHVFDGEKGQFEEKEPKKKVTEPKKVEEPEEKADDEPEEKPEEEKEEPDESEEKSEDIAPELKKFNEIFETDFSNWDDINIEEYRTRQKGFDELKIYADKAKELEGEKKKLEEKIAALEQSINPRSYFANEQEFLRQVYLKKYPDLNPETLGKIAKMSEEDIKKSSPVDILRTIKSLEYGDIYGSMAEIDEAIEEEYEIDLSESLEEQGTLKKNRVLVAAKEAVKKINKLREDTELPDEFNHEAKTAKLKDKQEKLMSTWKPFVEKGLPEKLKSLNINYQTKEGQKATFTYQVDREFIDEVVSKSKELLEFLAQRGIEFSDEAKEGIVNELLNTFERRHREKIYGAMVNDAITQMDLDTFKELHNPKPLKKSKEAPPKKTKKEEQHSKADAELEADLDGRLIF